jgi:hypothetical protein
VTLFEVASCIAGPLLLGESGQVVVWVDSKSMERDVCDWSDIKCRLGDPVECPVSRV